MKDNEVNLLQKIVVIVPEFQQWTGTRAMREIDFALGTNGRLPPKEVAKSLGLKAIIDPETLRVFDRLKHQAESLLESRGVKYLSGWAVPTDKAEEVFQALDELVRRYNDEKNSFLNRYDVLVEDWANAHPDFSESIRGAKLSRDSVSRRIKASYESFKVQPVNNEQEQALVKRVSGLGDELISSVAQLARIFFKESFLGKERANKKTISAVKRIRERLSGLSFLNSKINPLIRIIDNVLLTMPKEGYFGGQDFWRLATLIKTLGDEDLIHDIIEGKVSVEGLTDAQPESEPSELPQQACLFKTAEEESLSSQSGTTKAENPVSEESIEHFFQEESSNQTGSRKDEKTSCSDNSSDELLIVLPLSQEKAADSVETNEHEHLAAVSSSQTSLPKVPSVDVGEGFYF